MTGVVVAPVGYHVNAACRRARRLYLRGHLSADGDVHRCGGNPAKAGRLIGWRATSGMRDVVRETVRAEMES
jgi:GDP-D-mannose dehydratase